MCDRSHGESTSMTHGPQGQSYSVATVTKFPAGLRALPSRPRAQLRREPFLSMVPNRPFPPCLYSRVLVGVAATIQSYLTVLCPSLQQNTCCQTALVVRMWMVVGLCAKRADGAQPGGRRRSRVHLATPPLVAAPPDGSEHYVPRSIHSVYLVRVMRDCSQGYKTEWSYLSIQNLNWNKIRDVPVWVVFSRKKSSSTHCARPEYPRAIYPGRRRAVGTSWNKSPRCRQQRRPESRPFPLPQQWMRR